MSNETELLQAVLTVRQEIEKLEGRLAEVKEVKQNAESALIEYMDNRELKSFRSTALNCQVVRKETLYVSIDKEKKDEAFRWISEDCGRSDMIKPQIHNKTLSSFIGEMLKKGEQIPQELFKWFFRPELTIITAK
jgi:predicted  nucleic acid-binding Zn-ribbon protein